eukprot:366015-Chlamydomonas_euryale.AAC.2
MAEQLVAERPLVHPNTVARQSDCNMFSGACAHPYMQQSNAMTSPPPLHPLAQINDRKTLTRRLPPAPPQTRSFCTRVRWSPGPRRRAARPGRQAMRAPGLWMRAATT